MNEVNALHMTLPDMLEETCKRCPERKAVYFKGLEFDYRTLRTQVRRFAASLQRMGIEKGDRVAIMLPNCPHYTIVRC